MAVKCKLILIGGYLGSGKTTLLTAAASLLKARGNKVGLITNDLAKGLVDTSILSMRGWDVQEISGSCFCCSFDNFIEAAIYLKESIKCEWIIAEPVGSCTDLSATLLQPLKAQYKDQFTLLPLSVLTDPFQLRDMLKNEILDKKGTFYIFLKQLEEADYLLINKMDLLQPDELKELEDLLHTKFPGYPVYGISAISEKGISKWLQKISSDNLSGRRIASVDYDIYAEGEAMMGWYNASFTVQTSKEKMISWRPFCKNFIQLIQQVFDHEEILIGHLKTFIRSGASYAEGHLIETKSEVEIMGNEFASTQARLIVNIRAQAASETIKKSVDDIIEECRKQDIVFEIIDLNHLSPARPQPVHRYSEVIK